jgi:glycerol-3-phosphate dehydrogenase
LVIGAGVVGSAVARDLSHLSLKVGLAEARAEFGEGASKGNSALMCSGWDTPAGTLERELVTLGYRRYVAEGPALGLKAEETGSTMVAWTEEQAETLRKDCLRAQGEGFKVRLLSPAELYGQEPHLGPGALAGLYAEDERVVDPFSTVYAYVLDAVANGARYYPGFEAAELARLSNTWLVKSSGGLWLEAAIVVNCAGLWGDLVDSRAGFENFVVKPRRGQFLVFDKSARSLVNSIIEPTPSSKGRGVLVIPTIFGNVMLGPTAEDVERPEDRQVERKTLETLLEMGKAIVPELVSRPIVATFAGMRPATEKPEYRIVNNLESGFLTLGGIRSTGLSASMGLGSYASNLIASETGASAKAGLASPKVPDLSRDRTPPWQGSSDPDDRELVCFCESVTLGEIKRALGSPAPPSTIDGLRRRTRAGYGRCQGFNCATRLERLLASAPPSGPAGVPSDSQGQPGHPGPRDSSGSAGGESGKGAQENDRPRGSK